MTPRLLTVELVMGGTEDAYYDLLDEGEHIASVFSDRATAQTLAAAEQLLGALRDARAYLPGRPGCPPSLIERVDAAIAAAKGRT